jgi:hypothetical protein
LIRSKVTPNDGNKSIDGSNRFIPAPNSGRRLCATPQQSVRRLHRLGRHRECFDIPRINIPDNDFWYVPLWVISDVMTTSRCISPCDLIPDLEVAMRLRVRSGTASDWQERPTPIGRRRRWVVAFAIRAAVTANSSSSGFTTMRVVLCRTVRCPCLGNPLRNKADAEPGSDQLALQARRLHLGDNVDGSMQRGGQGYKKGAITAPVWIENPAAPEQLSELVRTNCQYCSLESSTGFATITA